MESAWDSLNVNTDGEVRLWRRLDREAPGGAEGVARIIGVDNGRPPLSATATLTITVTDVNDCPPRLLPPTIVHVTESSPPTRLATLAATDLDVWAMGHGPPFNFSLARTNPAHVKALIKIKFRQSEYSLLKLAALFSLHRKVHLLSLLLSSFTFSSLIIITTNIVINTIVAITIITNITAIIGATIITIITHHHL